MEDYTQNGINCITREIFFEDLELHESVQAKREVKICQSIREGPLQRLEGGTGGLQAEMLGARSVVAGTKATKLSKASSHVDGLRIIAVQPHPVPWERG